MRQVRRPLDAGPKRHGLRTGQATVQMRAGPAVAASGPRRPHQGASAPETDSKPAVPRLAESQPEPVPEPEPAPEPEEEVPSNLLQMDEDILEQIDEAVNQ